MAQDGRERAADIDPILITQAARQANFQRHMVERYLAMARHGGAEAVVVVNKCDLEQPATIQSWVAPLTAAGVPVLLSSTLTGQGLPELRALLPGRTPVLAGPSAVGKSSPVSALFPGLGLTAVAAGEISEDRYRRYVRLRSGH